MPRSAVPLRASLTVNTPLAGTTASATSNCTSSVTATSPATSRAACEPESDSQGVWLTTSTRSPACRHPHLQAITTPDTLRYPEHSWVNSQVGGAAGLDCGHDGRRGALEAQPEAAGVWQEGDGKRLCVAHAGQTAVRVAAARGACGATHSLALHAKSLLFLNQIKC